MFKDTGFFQSWAALGLPCASVISQATSLNCLFCLSYQPASWLYLLHFNLITMVTFTFCLKNCSLLAGFYLPKDRLPVSHRAVIPVPIPRICHSLSLAYGKECWVLCDVYERQYSRFSDLQILAEKNWITVLKVELKWQFRATLTKRDSFSPPKHSKYKVFIINSCLW